MSKSDKALAITSAVLFIVVVAILGMNYQKQVGATSQVTPRRTSITMPNADYNSVFQRTQDTNYFQPATPARPIQGE